MEKSKQAGFTVLEGLIAVAVLAIAGLGLAQAFSQMSAGDQKDRNFSSRDKVLDTVRSAAGMSVSIRNSYYWPNTVGVNPVLDSCVTENPSFVIPNPTNADCISGRTVPLTLYGPLVSGAGALASGAVAGPAGTPVYYDLFGQVCSPPSTTCPIKAWTTITPQCPPLTPLGPPAAKCDVAETLTVDYYVEPAPVPKAPDFAQVHGSFTVSVFQVSGETPSINTVLPKPSALPSPGPTPSNSGISNIHCPGNSVQWGHQCFCPWGMTLVSFIPAVCAPM